MHLTDRLKTSVVSAMTGLFSHGPTPLEHTLDHRGDLGLLGPTSVSWRVLGDASVFTGGVRALLVQSAHPEVVAGVEDHSSYRSDPLGRLTRTSVYVTETTYGAMPEVAAAVETVRRAHRPVRGRSARDKPYNAAQPALAAWVHNVLTDSFLAAYQAFGPAPLSPHEADQFVAEQAEIGELLGAEPLPLQAGDLTRWIADHPDRAKTAAQTSAIDFLRKPPLAPPVALGYRLVLNAAISTIPDDLCAQLDLRAPRWSRQIGHRTTSTLRWALGASPSWHLALIRCDAPVPAGLFRQPLPTSEHR